MSWDTGAAASPGAHQGLFYPLAMDATIPFAEDSVYLRAMTRGGVGLGIQIWFEVCGTEIVEYYGYYYYEVYDLELLANQVFAGGKAGDLFKVDSTNCPITSIIVQTFDDVNSVFLNYTGTQVTIDTNDII